MMQNKFLVLKFPRVITFSITDSDIFTFGFLLKFPNHIIFVSLIVALLGFINLAGTYVSILYYALIT